MILVIGGAFQGKKAYVEETFQIKQSEIADGQSCGLDDIYSCGCICHFHEWVKRQLEQGADLSGFAEELYSRNPDIILISNELGYGVVPVEAFDRRYREMVGRLCCELAAMSRQVHRVICKIGTVIKE